MGVRVMGNDRKNSQGGAPAAPPPHSRVKSWFLCLLALSHLAAFASLYTQWPGLYGRGGVMPAHQAKPRGFSVKTLAELFDTPLQATSEMVCVVGMVVSGLLTAFPSLRVSPAYALIGTLYFSLYQVGRTFMWFQWDILLLETTFLSVLVAPLLPSKSGSPHDSISLWLIRWLSFRLMFASGAVKLTSGCPAWWGLTAMNWHYESQCIPTPLAWWAHQTPDCIHQLETMGAYLIEIAYPFLFFVPIAAVRALGVYAQVFLMFAIMFTGNYNFFNILTIALCIASLEDRHLPAASTLVSLLSPISNGGLGALAALLKLPFRLLRSLLTAPLKFLRDTRCNPAGCLPAVAVLSVLALSGYLLRVLFNLGQEPGKCASITFGYPELEWFLSHSVPISIVIGLASLTLTILGAIINILTSPNKSRLRKIGEVVQVYLVSCVAVSLFAISLQPLTELDNDTQNKLPLSLQNLYHRSRPYHVTNSYGLFRSMTGVGGRPEVVLEGSQVHDGGWKEYEFYYKPGNLKRPPPVVLPHQPRLDWQMWFAALGSYDYNPWIIHLAYQMLRNSTDTLSLIKHNPFPEAPPKFIRALKYTYHYTRFGESVEEWWRRDSQEEYFPPIALYQPTLKQFLEYHGYLTPPPEPLHASPGQVELLASALRRAVSRCDSVVFVWTVCLAAMLPHFKALRFRFSLFGI